MRTILIFLLTISFVNASNLLTHNIYERSDRVDVMLSFDSPYEGKITQKRGENITTLTLSDLTYDKLIEKNINSPILQAFTIEPDKDNIKVILKSEKNIAVIASKTVDGFGLRIRTKPIFINKIQSTKVSSVTTNTKTPITTKLSEDLIDSRYLSVILLLSIMILFMFWVKKRVANKQTQVKAKNKNSWLFKQDTQNNSNGEINVLHKKQIDNSNSVVLLEFDDKKYLVMTGNSNVLLEKFSKSDIKNDSDFEKAFEDNRKKLDEYLKIQKDDSFDNYKSKAAGEYISKLEHS
ncbi:hypothetical protein [Sulfurospirillum arcachonense]|uniref:hypothetical protein n=1 Tax=Sulfurospirillum arcachonense TaxID=57666 RepID=UPI00046AE5D1|nr:hypothetical protein [Sulfurospirillum arcachonense]